MSVHHPHKQVTRGTILCRKKRMGQDSKNKANTTKNKQRPTTNDNIEDNIIGSPLSLLRSALLCIPLHYIRHPMIRRMRQLFFSFILLIASFVLGTASTDGVFDGVVELTDETFEHQTQASTGMTTGSWFVLFEEDDQDGGAENCEVCRSTIKPVMSSLANPTTSQHQQQPPSSADHNDEESDPSELSEPDTTIQDRGIVFASVDCATSPKTCQRFLDAVRRPDDGPAGAGAGAAPTMLYFHKKSMYTFPFTSSSTSALFTYDSVRRFVLEDFAEMSQYGPMTIPPPPSAMEEWIVRPMMDLYELGMRPENRLLFAAIGGMGVMLLITVVVLITTLLSSSSSSSTYKKDSNGNSSKGKKKKKN